MNIRISTTQYMGDLSHETTLEIEGAGSEEVTAAYKLFQDQANYKDKPVLTPAVTINVSDPVDGETVVKALKDAISQEANELERRNERLAGGQET